MRVIIICPPVSEKTVFEIINDNDYIIAVDAALSFCSKNRIKVDMAIGDFDSLEDKELLNYYPHIKLNEIKDETDSEEACKYAFSISNEVIMIGGIGGNRFEHSIANINLIAKYNSLVIISEYSKVMLLKPGTHEITDNVYISLFPFPTANVTLRGFKYPLLNHELIMYDSLGISNELNSDIGYIDVNQGNVLVIISKRDYGN